MLDVVVADVDGNVIGEATTRNDGFQTKVTSGDAEVNEYTMTLRCADDATVADSFRFWVSYTPAPTSMPTDPPPTPWPTPDCDDGTLRTLECLDDGTLLYGPSCDACDDCDTMDISGYGYSCEPGTTTYYHDADLDGEIDTVSEFAPCWCEASGAEPTFAPTTRIACEDSASWYWKKSKYDCDFVAKKSKRCKSKYTDFDDVSSIDACPVACGECESPCEDSASWYWKKSKYDCDYVAKKSKRCKSKYADEGGVSSFDACPIACGQCEAPCEDSTSWYWKKSKYDCAWVEKKIAKRCKAKIRDDDDVKAKEACPVACQEC